MSKPQKKTIYLAGMLFSIAITGIIDKYLPGQSLFLGFTLGVVAILLLAAAEKE